MASSAPPTPFFSASSFPEASSVPSLLGKSNFAKWQSAILSHLTSNEQSRALLFCGWTKPILPLPPASRSQTSSTSIHSSPFSPSSAIDNDNPNLTTSSQIHAFMHPNQALTIFKNDHRAYELANLQATRFIRATLAMNVVPFVRQHTSAKTLWEQLIYLYGERCGIDVVGGPAVFGRVNLKGAKLASIHCLHQNPEMRKSASRSTKREEDESMLMAAPPVTQITPGRRLKRKSSLGFGHGNTSVRAPQALTVGEALLGPPPEPFGSSGDPKSKSKSNKKVTFLFPFRRPTRDERSGSNTKTLITSPSARITSDLSFPPPLISHHPLPPLIPDFDHIYNPSRRKASLTDTAAGAGLRKRRNKDFEMEMKSLVLKRDAETPLRTPTEENAEILLDEEVMQEGLDVCAPVLFSC